MSKAVDRTKRLEKKNVIARNMVHAQGNCLLTFERKNNVADHEPFQNLCVAGAMENKPVCSVDSTKFKVRFSVCVCTYVFFCNIYYSPLSAIYELQIKYSRQRETSHIWSK
jgi:hypothetical protein